VSLLGIRKVSLPTAIRVNGESAQGASDLRDCGVCMPTIAGPPQCSRRITCSEGVWMSPGARAED
jgi:hypothetical protein